MLIQNIALVPEAGDVTSAELLRVSAALQKQASSHFGPCWGIQASVDAFLELEQVPAGYAPIVLSAPENARRALEISLDANGQPYARVALSAGWSLAASRACLELLINPFGQRTISAISPRSDQGPAEILVEACGAFGEMPTAYAVNDVAVSDFCTPAFFRPAAGRGNESYSFRGSLGAPLSLLRSGHMAWFDPISNSWWLRTFHDEHPSDRQIGPLQARGRPLRELVLRHEPRGAGSSLSLEPMDARIRWQWLREQASAASVARAQRLRQTLGLPQGTQHYEEEEDEEETVAMAISVPRHEPVRSHQRSGPPPLPERFEDGGHTLDSSPYPSAEFERSKAILARHERYSGGVIVAARDISVSSLERRDTLPLTQLLPQPAASESQAPAAAVAEASAATVEARVEAHGSASEQNVEPQVEARESAREQKIEAAPARSATEQRPVSAQRPVTTERPAVAERTVTSSVSHSSIPPIAMLAEPVRNETSRAGLMVAAAGAAALLTVAIMSSGTRSAAHGTPASSPKPAAAVAAKPDTGSQQVAPPAPAAALPMPVPPVVAKPQQQPVALANATPERLSPAQSVEAERERQEARERRRQQRERALSERQAQSAAEPAGHGERTAAIENLLDTRR